MCPPCPVKAEHTSLESELSEASSSATAEQREVRFEHSRDLADLLIRLRLSVLVSTYQAGKMAALGGVRRGDGAAELVLSMHNFDRPMGVAVTATVNKVAVAARDKVWFLQNARELAPQIAPAGQHDACLLTRMAQVTGDIQSHEMAWGHDELWIVNTAFSCLCTLDTNYSFVPRWQPPFISGLAAEDRCHLNGLAMHQGRPRFVTAMAETDTAGAWRENKVETGCVIDVDSGQTVVRGFAMPHSPRWHNNALWLLDSGRGALVRIDPARGSMDTVARFPGYTRGLTLHDHFAFVGLSRIRETSTFGGVPIAEQRERLKCGMAVVDLRNGELAGQFEFLSGVEEIFDVSVLPGVVCPAIRGPFAADDGDSAVWVVPAPGKSPGKPQNTQRSR